MRAAVFYPARFYFNGQDFTSDSVQHKQFIHWRAKFESLDLVVFLKWDSKQRGRTVLSKGDIRVLGLPFPENNRQLFLTKMPLILMHLFWLIWKERTHWDMVILFDPYFPNWVAYFICRCFRLPLALRMTGRHDLGVLEAVRHKGFPVANVAQGYQRFLAWFQRHAASVGQVVTDGDASFAPPTTRERIAFCVESFVTEREIPQECPYPLQDPANPLRVLSVSRIVPWKGIHVLIEAVARLRDSQVPIHLDVIGPTYGMKYGNYEGRLRNMVAQLNLDKVVSIHGYLSGAGEFERLWRSAHVLAVTCTSDCDGVPKVIFEAMAFGIPIVAARVGSIPRLLSHQETALLIPPQDAESLATALMRIATDYSLRRRLSQQSFAAVRQYTIEKLAPLQVALLISGAFGRSK